MCNTKVSREDSAAEFPAWKPGKGRSTASRAEDRLIQREGRHGRNARRKKIMGWGGGGVFRKGKRNLLVQSGRKEKQKTGEHPNSIGVKNKGLSRVKPRKSVRRRIRTRCIQCSTLEGRVVAPGVSAGWKHNPRVKGMLEEKRIMDHYGVTSRCLTGSYGRDTSSTPVPDGHHTGP